MNPHEFQAYMRRQFSENMRNAASQASAQAQAMHNAYQQHFCNPQQSYAAHPPMPPPTGRGIHIDMSRYPGDVWRDPQSVRVGRG